MNKFLLADCMNPETGLPSYPDKFFDLAIIDPPYGIGEDGSKNESRGKAVRIGPKFKQGGSIVPAKNYKPYAGNDKEPPTAQYFKELFRISKNQIIWGANHFIDRIGGIASPCWIVWDKQNGECDFADCELAWTSFKTAVRKVDFKWNGFLQGNMVDRENRLHPNQKPVALYRWLLENYAKSGDLILDTHVGSASSLIACEQMGFEYHAFELDADYFQAANNRMSKGIQTNLFAHGTNAPQNRDEQLTIFQP